MPKFKKKQNKKITDKHNTLFKILNYFKYKSISTIIICKVITQKKLF